MARYEVEATLTVELPLEYLVKAMTPHGAKVQAQKVAQQIADTLIKSGVTDRALVRHKVGMRGPVAAQLNEMEVFHT